MGILEKLCDLHKQATEERSHYYTGKIILEAIHEISTLRRKISDSAASNIDYTAALEKEIDSFFMDSIHEYPGQKVIACLASRLNSVVKAQQNCA